MKSIHILSSLSPSQAECRQVRMAGHLSITEAITGWPRRFGVCGPLQVRTCLCLWGNLQADEEKRCQCKEHTLLKPTKTILIRNVFTSGAASCHFPVCFGFYSLSPACLLMQNKHPGCFCAREHPENSTNLTCLFSYFISKLASAYVHTNPRWIHCLRTVNMQHAAAQFLSSLLHVLVI